MRKIIFISFSFILTWNVLNAQDYGTQLQNSDFESEWKTYSGNKTEGSEPYCWHSFHSAKGSKANMAEADHISGSSSVRPGSKGTRSIKVFPKEIKILFVSIIANGSLTNGRMNCGSTSASSDDNHIYTDRGTAEFNTPIDVVPDSITVWLSFYAKSDSYYAAFHAAVHGDSDFILYGNGSESDQTQQVADANLEYTRTTTSSSDVVWVRKSIPFISKGQCTTPKYLLVTMATNKTPGEGSSNDFFLVDDIVLVYNPTITTEELTTTDFDAEYGTEVDIEIPFSLTGSMSVSNLNKEANEVIAQLSDAEGNFDNPIEIGRITTNTSGTIPAKIPASVGEGNYKVRVVSTNYPMTADPSPSIINLKRHYTISFVDLSSSIGTLAGDGDYPVSETETITVTAQPTSDDYKFAYWIEDESVVSLDAEYTFTAERSRTLRAVFKSQFTVAITTDGGGTVSTEGGKYADGEGLCVTATPEEGYVFVNWTENGVEVSKSTNYTFAVNSNTSLVAHFKKAVQIVGTVNIDGAGAISGAGTYILDGESVAVLLVAVTSDNTRYRFLNWTEDDVIVSEESSYSFTTSAHRTLIANFAYRYSILASVSDIGGGEVTGASVYDEGDAVTLIAYPDEGYRFVGWYEADTLYSTESMITFTANNDRDMIATFAKQCYVTVTSTYDNAGTITGVGTYDEGSFVNLSVTPHEGFRFLGWSILEEIVSDEQNYSFEVVESVAIQAVFEAIPQYDISVSVDPVSGGSVTGTGIYYVDSDVTITAHANAGYTFLNWTENGSVISELPDLSLQIIENRTLTAHFKTDIEGYTITLPTVEGGTVYGAGLYAAGSEVTVTAVADEKYQFNGWTVNGELISTDIEYSFILEQSIELCALFERVYESYTITVTTSDEVAGSIEGAGVYNEGSSVTIKAIPSLGYRFSQWIEDGEIVSTNEEYTFDCVGERNIQAEFVKVYTVKVDDFIGATIKGYGTGIFDAGTNVVLSLSIAEGYRFTGWYDADADTLITTSATCTFVAEADRHLKIAIAEKGQLYSISLSYGGSVSGLNNGTFESGETVTLIATPAEGFEFSGWVEDGEVVSTDAMYTFIAEENRDLYALFTPLPEDVEVSIVINDDTFGKVIGAGIYTEGEFVTLIATPADGYEFVAWERADGTVVSTTAIFSFTVMDDEEFLAQFRFIEKESISDVDVSVHIYPNPVSETVFLDSDREIEKVEIYSLRGTIVYSEQINAATWSFPIAHFPAGLYILVLKNSDTIVAKQVISKK